MHYQPVKTNKIYGRVKELPFVSRTSIWSTILHVIAFVAHRFLSIGEIKKWRAQLSKK